MVINLVGKFSNQWGAEWFVKKGFESLGHEVLPLEIGKSYALLRSAKIDALTIVMQGYGLAPKLIESGRRLTKKPWILWHAEILPQFWPTDDPVTAGKTEELRRNVWTFDAVGHNCKLPLKFIRHIGGKNVFHAPANGVDSRIHRCIEGIEKKFLIGFYGYPSPRRLTTMAYLQSNGIPVEWRMPQDGCFGEDLTRFINECHCILNLHYSDTRNTECRLYEAMGCGVPVISEQISMPELFPEDYCHINYFGSPEELLVLTNRACQYAASNPEWSAWAGREAMTWLHKNSSYAKRCQNFLEQIGNLPL